MKNRVIHNHKNKGQSLLEFALVVPVLFLVVLGTFDLGFAVYAGNTLSLAAREGARLGIIRSKTDAQICQRVVDTAVTLNVTCTVNPTPTRIQGQPITVNATFVYAPLTPLVGNIIGNGGSITLKGQSTMIAE